MKKYTLNYFLLYSGLLLSCPLLLVGQTTSKSQVTVQGKMTIFQQGVFSTAYDFVNSSSAKVKNGGRSVFYGDFHNDGEFTTLDQSKTGSAVFSNSYLQQDQAQTISGDQVSTFDRIEFNSDVKKQAFVLQNNIDVTHQVDFQKGVVVVDDQVNEKTRLSKGMMSFLNGAVALNASDQSHVQGLVEKVGNQAFDFPIGDKEHYRKAHISSPEESKAVFQSRYSFGDKAFFEARNAVSGVIKKLSTQEFWLVEKSTSSSSDVILTLSWDEATSDAALLTNPSKDLHIVMWDDKQQMWVDQGGVVDLQAKQVSTPTTLRQYGFFTLATVKTDWLIEGDIVIYNLVSANYDGMNDYFLIDNINRFPQNTVEIYNRWGLKVFQTSNYDSRGDGSENVFKGFNQGKGTSSTNKILPSGTYYYIVTYEVPSQSGTQVIKKTGSLHLETN